MFLALSIECIYGDSTMFYINVHDDLRWPTKHHKNTIKDKFANCECRLIKTSFINLINNLKIEIHFTGMSF